MLLEMLCGRTYGEAGGLWHRVVFRPVTQHAVQALMEHLLAVLRIEQYA